jgi:hypothetical protein
MAPIARRRFERGHVVPSSVCARHKVRQALLLQQLAVRPGLDDATAVEHIDEIGLSDRAQ